MVDLVLPNSESYKQRTSLGADLEKVKVAKRRKKCGKHMITHDPDDIIAGNMLDFISMG